MNLGMEREKPEQLDPCVTCTPYETDLNHGLPTNHGIAPTGAGLTA
jgi:hypothetical protein